MDRRVRTLDDRVNALTAELAVAQRRAVELEAWQKEHEECIERMNDDHAAVDNDLWEQDAKRDARIAVLEAVLQSILDESMLLFHTDEDDCRLCQLRVRVTAVLAARE